MFLYILLCFAIYVERRGHYHKRNFIFYFALFYFKIIFNNSVRKTHTLNINSLYFIAVLFPRFQERTLSDTRVNNYSIIFFNMSMEYFVKEFAYIVGGKNSSFFLIFIKIISVYPIHKYSIADGKYCKYCKYSTAVDNFLA